MSFMLGKCPLTIPASGEARQRRSDVMLDGETGWAPGPSSARAADTPPSPIAISQQTIHPQ